MSASVGAPTKIAHAIEQIQNRGTASVPSIDFTQHTLEDGTSISTQERVIKDVSSTFVFVSEGKVGVSAEANEQPFQLYSSAPAP